MCFVLIPCTCESGTSSACWAGPPAFSRVATARRALLCARRERNKRQTGAEPVASDGMSGRAPPSVTRWPRRSERQRLPARKRWPSMAGDDSALSVAGPNCGRGAGDNRGADAAHPHEQPGAAGGAATSVETAWCVIVHVMSTLAFGGQGFGALA